jgi:hypothetical protein
MRGQTVSFQVQSVEWTRSTQPSLSDPSKPTGFLPRVVMTHNDRGTRIKIDLVYFPGGSWLVTKIIVGDALAVEGLPAHQEFVKLLGHIIDYGNLISVLTSLIESGRVGATQEWQDGFVSLTVCKEAKL